MKKIIWGLGVSFSLFSCASAYMIGNVEVVSRAERGAQELRRSEDRPEYQDIVRKENEYQAWLEELKEQNPSKYKKLTAPSVFSIQNEHALKRQPERFVTLRKVAKDKLMTYWRPLQYADKDRIVVHHTAEGTTYKSKEAFEQFLRGVYRYHALVHGRGDIGYNFIIAPDGTIYEGRYGGEDVVGAHAQFNNFDSIGIALVGNFDKTKPTLKQVVTLQKLSIELVKKHGISLGDRKWLRLTKQYPYIQQTTLPFLVGHGDIGMTSCPGKNVKKLLPGIREEIKNSLASLPM